MFLVKSKYKYILLHRNELPHLQIIKQLWRIEYIQQFSTDIILKKEIKKKVILMENGFF